MKKYLSAALPAVVAIVLYVIISCVYFSPMFDGLTLRQGDITHHKGMAKEIIDYKTITGERILWSNNMFAGMPSYQTSTVNDGNFMGTVLKIMKLSLPGPIGVIFMAMLGFYILCLCMKIDPWLSILGGLAFGLASIFYLYLGAGHTSKMRALSLIPPVLGGMLLIYRNKYISGAAIFALFLSLHLYVNHFQVTYYLLYLLVFAGIAIGISKIMKGETIDFMKATAVVIVAGLLGVLPSTNNLLLTNEYSQDSIRGKSELTIDKDGIEKDLNNETALDPSYITEYNMSAGELFSTIIPNAKGGQSGRINNQKEAIADMSRANKGLIAQVPASSYWGEQTFTGGAIYFGALMFLLFILGLVVAKNNIKWGLLALCLFILGLAVKDGAIIHFFIDNVPLFDKFRDHKMILMLLGVIMPFVALMGINDLIKDKEYRQRKKKAVLITTGVVSLFMLLIFVAPKALFDFHAQGDEALFDAVSEQLGEDTAQSLFEDIVVARVNIFKADAGRSLLFIILGSLIFLAFAFDKINKWIFIPILSVLVMVDMVGVDRRYINSDKVGKQFRSYVSEFDKLYPHRPSQADLAILEAEITRAENFDSNQSELFKGLKPILDHSTGKTKKSNQALLEKITEFGALNLGTNYRVHKFQPSQYGSGLTQDGTTPFFHKALGGYHGAKLMKYQELIDFQIENELKIWEKEANEKGPIEPLINLGVLNMLNTKYIIYNPEAAPVENPFANGNAWFVDDLVFVENADEEIKKVGEINTKLQATVQKNDQGLLSNISPTDSTSFIEMTKYSPDELTYISESNTSHLAVFSEVFYDKGWKAFIGDSETEILKVNYLLRGLVIPSGNHEITFRFEPSTYQSGKSISSIGSILIILLILFAGYYSFRQRGEALEE